MNQRVLSEIVLYRTIATLFLIVTHSFTIYGGAWPYPQGIEPCASYAWIVYFAAHAMLGGFTFISGYLLAHQKDKIQRQPDGIFIRKKAQRLLLPGIIFSVFYFFLFEDITQSSFLSFCYSLSAGHMWYLPMLMWCLILGHFLLKHRVSLTKMFVLSIVLLFFYFLPLPFNLNKFLYYSMYFVLGMIAYYKRCSDVNKHSLLLKWGGYLLIFVFATNLIINISTIPLHSVIMELLVKETRTYIRVLSGLFGVWVYWQTSLFVVKHYTIPVWVESISRYSFGIYLFHQFILQILLYHTPLPQQVGTYILPWICLVITIPLSWLLAYWMTKTRLGKYLLG